MWSKLKRFVFVITCIFFCVGCSADKNEKSVIDSMSDQWDSIIYQDDEYVIVRKVEETYTDSKLTVGILDNEGNWLVPLTSDHIFATAQLGGSMYYTGNEFMFANLGEGVLVLSRHFYVINKYGQIQNRQRSNYEVNVPDRLLWNCFLYNVNTKQSKQFEAKYISYCENGQMLMYPSDESGSYFKIMTPDGEAKSFGVYMQKGYDGPSFSGICEGLIFANGCFYDLKGKKVLDLTQYDLTKTPHFENGTCKITFLNDRGSTWEATIDMNGDFISEPRKIADPKIEYNTTTITNIG